MNEHGPTLFLTVGLPGAGKTTLARRLEAEHGALRLTMDDWMLAIVGASGGVVQDVVEGRLVALAERVLELGVDVILDFGLWSREERSALRWMASQVGARTEIRYLPIDPETQLARVEHRWRTAPESTYFEMTQQHLDEWRPYLHEPDAEELDPSSPIPPPPAGFESWRTWITHRWPPRVPKPRDE